MLSPFSAVREDICYSLAAALFILFRLAYTQYIRIQPFRIPSRLPCVRCAEIAAVPSRCLFDDRYQERDSVSHKASTS